VGVGAGLAAGAATGSGTTGPTTATTAGPGPNVNATKPKPKDPMSATFTNPDGSTRTMARGPDGVVTITDTDANGNVRQRETITRNPDGTRTSEVTDAAGITSSGSWGDYATVTRPDGTQIEKWVPPGGGESIDTYDANGNLTGTKWNTPDGSGTSTYAADGSSTHQYEYTDGTVGTETFDANGNPTGWNYSNSNNGHTGTNTTQPNGDYVETYSWPDGSTTATRTTNPDGSVTESYKGSGPGGDAGIETTRVSYPDGSSRMTRTGGGSSTTAEYKPDGSMRDVTKYDNGQTSTTTRDPSKGSYASETKWTDANGNAIDDPYKVDLDFDFGTPGS
jgi:hypothetical protein